MRAKFMSAQGEPWSCLALARAEASPDRGRREVRAQNEPAIETACLETAVRLGDLIERDPLGDARADGAGRQQAEELLKVLLEPGGMSRPHQI
jgi:hypothetical protein